MIFAIREKLKLKEKQYSVLAPVYDALNADIDYSAWADFIETCFDKYLPRKPALVLDLACGTGMMTYELATRGYDMIGSDISEEMLAVAAMRCAGKKVLLLRQDMRSLELYGTVGAIVSCLDSVNYLTSSEGLAECFCSVNNYLDPGGLFIFDVNTPYKFKNIYADNSYILETEDESVYCGWQNYFNPRTGICDFYISIFKKEGDGRYTRHDEHQREKMFGKKKLTGELEKAGFELVDIVADYGFSSPESDSERWYIITRKLKQ